MPDNKCISAACIRPCCLNTFLSFSVTTKRPLCYIKSVGTLQKKVYLISYEYLIYRDLILIIPKSEIHKGLIQVVLPHLRMLDPNFTCQESFTISECGIQFQTG